MPQPLAYRKPQTVTIPGGVSMGAAWLILAVVGIVFASAGRAPADVFRYSLVLVGLYLLLTHGDRFAGPIQTFARSLGGQL